MVEKRSHGAVNWLEIKSRFIHSSFSTGELAKEFDLNPATVTKRCTREGWMVARIAEQQRVAAIISEEASTKRSRVLTQFNEDDLKMSRALRARCAKLLNKSDTTTANSDGVKADELTPSALRQIAATAEIAQRMGRLALGASTDNHGLAGQGGEGPVGVATVTVEAYAEARKEMLKDF